jgi:microcystin degradation protein MlrC
VLEKSKEVLAVSICAGFTGADIHEIGPSVTVAVDIKAHNNDKVCKYYSCIYPHEYFLNNEYCPLGSDHCVGESQ